MATHSSILAWRIPWSEEPGGLQSMGSQRVRYHWVTNSFIFTYMQGCQKVLWRGEISILFALWCECGCDTHSVKPCMFRVSCKWEVDEDSMKELRFKSGSVWGTRILNDKSRVHDIEVTRLSVSWVFSEIAIRNLNFHKSWNFICVLLQIFFSVCDLSSCYMCLSREGTCSKPST